MPTLPPGNSPIIPGTCGETLIFSKNHENTHTHMIGNSSKNYSFLRETIDFVQGSSGRTIGHFLFFCDYLTKVNLTRLRERDREEEREIRKS
jgi:hypothetical protein